MALAATIRVETRFAFDAAADRLVGITAEDAAVHDLSCDGCVVLTDRLLAPGMVLTLSFAAIGVLTAKVVRRHGREAGCAFMRPISVETVIAALDTDAPVRVTLHAARLSTVMDRNAC